MSDLPAETEQGPAPEFSPSCAVNGWANERKTTHKQYIGDGVYAAYDGYHIVLTTENGIETTNTICLEGSVYENLVRYATALIERVNAGSDSPNIRVSHREE